MSEAQALMCSSCGAPLNFKPGEIQVKCEFCGNVMVVPEHLRQPSAQAVFQMAAPIIQIETGPMIEQVYRNRQRGSRALGCFILFFVLFIVGVTVLPVLITSAAIKPMLDSIFKQAPIFGNVANAVSGYATETLTFGDAGTGPGLFQDPRHLAVDPNGNIYVSDYDTGRIQRFDSTGKFLNTWTLPGKKPIVASIAADRSGNVYVVQDFAFPRSPIFKYDGATGKLVDTIDTDKDSFESVVTLADGNLMAFSHQINSDDLVKLSPDGKVLSRVSKAISSQLENSSLLSVAIAVDGLGNTFVLCPFDYAVLRFSPSGKFTNRFGRQGDADGDFRSMSQAIAVDGKSRVYVSNFGKILVFDADGRYLDAISTSTYPAYGMVFNDKNELYYLSQSKVHKLKLLKP